MLVPSGAAPKLLRYWLTGDQVLVEWLDADRYIERSLYATTERLCDLTRRPYADVELLDGEPATDLEELVYDILCRCEPAAISPLCRGFLADAPPIVEAA